MQRSRRFLQGGNTDLGKFYAEETKRFGGWGWSMICDLKVEKAITENLKVGVVRIVLH